MRLRRGQIVECSFLDHVSGGGKPIKFTAYGRLVAVNKQSITIAGWDYAQEPSEMPVDAIRELQDSNIVHWTIVRSAITAIYQLRRDR